MPIDLIYLFIIRMTEAFFEVGITNHGRFATVETEKKRKFDVLLIYFNWKLTAT